MELGLSYVVHAVFFLLMDLFVLLITFSKRKDSRSQNAFCGFALVVSILQMVAMLIICQEHGIAHFGNKFVFLLYLLIVTLPAVSSYLMGFWLVRLFSIGGGVWSRRKKIISSLPAFLYILMCLVSFKTHWIFYMDENWVYQRGTLFFLQPVVPYSYLLGVFILLVWEKIRNHSISNGASVKFILLYALPPFLGTVAQIFLNLHGCFSELGISVGLVLVYIGMYMGDAEEHRRLKYLAEYTDNLQQANARLRNSIKRGELQAKTVAETIRGGLKIGKFDRNFTFKYISEQLAQMLGYTVDEMMETSGGNMAGLVDRDEVRVQLPFASSLAVSGKMFTLNYKVRCKDGSWKHVEERGRLVRSEGAEDEIWSVIVDKDELVQVENALANVEKSRKRLAEYNDIISNAGLGVWFIYKKEGSRSRMRANGKMREILGIDKNIVVEDEVYDFWYERILESEIPTVRNSLNEMLQGRFSEMTFLWRHPEKGVTYVRCGGTAEKLPDGTVILSGYYCDVTDIVNKEKEQERLLKDALAAAEESSRAKTAFLNNMSHDIRTPMNAIIGFANLMEKEFNNPEKLKEYLDKLKNSGDFLLSLINNVLEMARIESGKTDMVEELCNLKDITEKTADIFSADLKKNNVTLETATDILHANVYADVVKIREIVVNLVSNAIKYSKKDGHVSLIVHEVPCSREGYGTYELIVKDNGIGMSKDYLPHIFEAFARERNFTECKIAGTGLGLPIVKKLVDLMEGNIQVESEEGVGTQFTIRLECKICTNESAALESQEIAAGRANLVGKRILLAEDNDLNAEIASTLLVDAGCIVDRASDGAFCINMLKNASPDYYDVILMDVQMPNMDGYEATRRIRALDDSRKDIPIVAMTANAFEEDRRAAFDAGMNGHVPKPFSMEVLERTLAELVK